MDIHHILISIVEGITEFIPVSSTAHIIITSKLLHVDTTDVYTKFYLLFIQMGALLAGILLFSKKLLTDKKTFINICISFIPTAIIGLILYKLFKLLLEGNMLLIAATLLIGGLVFIYLEKIFIPKYHADKDEISKLDAFIIGVAQALAIVPGVSRSGVTIATGLFRGIKKAVVIEYSFILAIPTVAAAVLYDVYKSRDILAHMHSWGDLILGFTVAFVSAFIVLYFLKKYLGRISLTGFGWYRIVLAIILFLSII